MNRLESVKVAAVQFESRLGDLDGNRRRMLVLAEEAAENGAKLIVFPEMATSGYIFENRREIAPYAEPIPGPTTELFQAVAEKYSCYVVIGLPEVDPSTDIFYNSAVLIGPEGVAGRYRKTHLFAADPRWAREGNEGIPVFSTKIGRIAMLICMDAMYFEPARIAALKGADIIAFPTNWVGEKNNPPSKTWALRAKENGLCWAAANRWGQERGAQFTGGSAVIGSEGEVQDWKLSGDGIVYGKYQPSYNNRKERILEFRKPSAYHDLLLHPYLWKEGATRPTLPQASFEVCAAQLSTRGTLEQWLSNVSKWLELELQKNEENVKHRMIILPEMDITGTEETEAGLEFYQHSLHSIASKYGIYIVASVSKNIDGNRVPTAFLLGSEGCIGTYEQVHRDGLGRGGYGRSGFCTLELPFARIGLLTGGDAEFPESYRILAKQGADLIAVSAGGTESYQSWMQRIWAHENDVIMAVAEPSESGGSLIFLHRQLDLEGQPDREEVLRGILSPEMTSIARSRPFLRRLKNDLYDLLVQNKND
ncbi:Nitrilase/cyanide hydratase and apolipoprotein N-acyltransferase [Bacillus methanolicus PB1]|uniref:Nitrilase/cyanide hydratase and apolipoprotein N-acyltransferase n=1 Tax=Bacillus methanolicus PB1 TaxID=997296 RepID=I3E1T0_BACMT|nr:nitrilase-related carbon-nitrogen hydrolase [Bacillus methanolicus]EIJ80451.1 Nitrilase/cyanide hydratase and apolipoprotein N-acyltransferase [Bacillus methanolicus PB1]